MKSKVRFNAVIALLVFLACACEPKKHDDTVDIAKDANDATIEDRDDRKDADFVVNTIAGSYAEVRLAQLAETHATDAAVKDIARTLQADHTKVILELKSYADKKGIAVFANETDKDSAKIAGLLDEKKAENFDKEWCKMLKDKHQESINKFESILKKSEDQELKNWVATTLPTLKHHMEMLEQQEEKGK